MTSVVTISAHCGDTKEVHVVVTDAGSLVEEFDIANGEKAERYAYDDRVITVKEVVKVDRRAKEIEDAEFSLRQATLRYEDAASRGFPLGNAALLKADAIAKHDALDALTAPAVPSVADYAASYPIPDGAVNADPLAAAFDPAGHALMTDSVPAGAATTEQDKSIYAAMADNYRKDATPQPAIETKTYADGTVATGPGPLPDLSPAELDAISKAADNDAIGAVTDANSPDAAVTDANAPLTAEAKTFLDSLDPAPMISDGTTDSVEGPTES